MRFGHFILCALLVLSITHWSFAQHSETSVLLLGELRKHKQVTFTVRSPAETRTVTLTSSHNYICDTIHIKVDSLTDVDEIIIDGHFSRFKKSADFKCSTNYSASARYLMVEVNDFGRDERIECAWLDRVSFGLTVPENARCPRLLLNGKYFEPAQLALSDEMTYAFNSEMIIDSTGGLKESAKEDLKYLAFIINDWWFDHYEILVPSDSPELVKTANDMISFLYQFVEIECKIEPVEDQKMSNSRENMVIRVKNGG